MKLGLLLFDDSERTLPDKIARGVAHYAGKFGTMPTTCCVRNPGKLDRVGPISVRALATVLEHHLWIGREEK